MSKFTMSLCLWNPQNASRVMKYMTPFPVVKQWVFSNSGDPCFKSFNSWIACLREEISPCSIACIRKFSLSLIFTSIADRHTILQYYNTFQAFSMSGSSTEGSMPEVSSIACKEFFIIDFFFRSKLTEMLPQYYTFQASSMSGCNTITIQLQSSMIAQQTYVKWESDLNPCFLRIEAAFE